MLAKFCILASQIYFLYSISKKKKMGDILHVSMCCVLAMETCITTLVVSLSLFKECPNSSISKKKFCVLHVFVLCCVSAMTTSKWDILEPEEEEEEDEAPAEDVDGR